MLVNLKTEPENKHRVIIMQELTPVDIFQKEKFSLKQFSEGFWYKSSNSVG